MDSFESSFIEKLSEVTKNYAVLTEEFSSMRRDVERIGKGVDKINERHEAIRMNCAEHCADTKLAFDAARSSQEEIREHKQNHLAWYGVVLAFVALLNLPVGEFVKRLFGFVREK